nr:ABC transporter transmembrane domain-containing protein [Bacilli bacterium]
MKENIEMLKEWYKLAKPPIWIWLFQFLTVSISSVAVVIQAIYTAHATSYLVAKDYDLAILNLGIVLVIEIVRLVFWHLNYRNTSNLGGKSYLQIQDKIFEKIYKCKESNFKNVSKEKLLNIFHSDVYEVAFFSDTICSKFRYLISIILILIYIINVNIYVSVAIVFIIVSNYIILNKINKKIAESQKRRKKLIDKEFESFSEVIDSKNILNSLDIKEKVKTKYLMISDKYIKSRKDYDIKTSYLDNYYKMYYKILIFILTLVMIYLLRNDLVSFAIYLV